MKSKMGLVIFCLALLVPLIYSLCYAQTDDKQKAFVEQKLLIEESIAGRNREIERLKMELDSDEVSLSIYNGSLTWALQLEASASRLKEYEERVDRTANEIKRKKAKIEERESAIRELKMKKGELKIKVIETYGKLPEWWGTE